MNYSSGCVSRLLWENVHSYGVDVINSRPIEQVGKGD